MKKNKVFIFLAGLFLLSLPYFVLTPYGYHPIHPIVEKGNAWLIRSILYKFRKSIDPCFNDRKYPFLVSNRSLDVVMPIVEKDLLTARESIKSIKANVLHPIRNIYLVAPESLKIRQFAKEMHCKFVLENEVVPFFSEIRKHGGWILQQFIKLNADYITDSEDILIVDSDTCFLRPQTFIDDKSERYTFHAHSDYSILRKDFTRRLFKTKAFYKVDFVAHHMIIKREWLKELKKTIENLHGNKSWAKILLNKVSKDYYGFSEYDIYATYVALNHSKSMKIYSSANALIYRERFEYFDTLRAIYSQDFKSMSSHSFIKMSSDIKY